MKRILGTIIIIILLVIILIQTGTIQNPLLSVSAPDILVGESVSLEEENYTIRYQEILGEGPLAQMVRTNVLEFVENAQTEAEQVPDEFMSTPYEYSVDTDLFISEGTTSVRMVKYAYTGGAHGNAFYDTITVVNEDEGTEQTLADLYPTAEEQQALLDEVVRQLNEQKDSEETFFFDGAIEEVTFETLKEFTISEGVLSIFFGQYELSPYSEGILEVTIPFE